MLKTIFVAIFFVLLPRYVVAEDFTFGAVTPEEVALVKYDLDSFSNAAVLNEYGRAFMVFNDTRGYPELIVDYHVRIKLFNREGYRCADIQLPAYQDESGERRDVLSEIKAVTINVMNGRVVSTPLEKAGIYQEKVSKYLTQTKFTFPDLQDGSIIEYRYRLVSPHIFNFKTWQLQEDIPKVNSLFEAIIPGLYTYNVILRGPYRLTTEDAKLDRGAFRIAGRDIDCSHLTYGMRDIPAFVSEDYMTAPSNFKSAIYFELSDIYRLNGTNVKITKEWRDVDRELVTDPNFGGQMKRDNVFKSLLPEVLEGASDDLGKAKAVYRYIQTHIKWNHYLGKYGENGVKDALAHRSGNIGDINLALVAGLMAAGLDAEAVILSTRDNGVVNDLHPVLSDFNYVVAKVNIGEGYHLLDASDPLLPFGLLPLHCLNGKARVIDLKEPSYWITPTSAQKSATQYMLTATLLPNGMLKGQLVTQSLGYAALRKRRELASFNTAGEYIEQVNERVSGLEILEGHIEGADDLERPFTERYDVEMKLYDSVASEKFFFNPFFLNRIGRNPFNLDERTYPVDLGAAREDRVSMTIELPDGCVIISKPDDYRLVLEESGGRYVTKTQQSGTIFSFSQLLTLDHSTYPPESYFALKELFSRVIRQEKIDVVFHKTTER